MYGIMLHHFHDVKKHIVEQGSISAETFSKLLDFYSIDHNILNADEWMEKALNGSIKENDVCITFDDSLMCQYDVALPVLEARGIKAFWFVYSTPLLGETNRLEIYRHFRFLQFKDIDEFYNVFFEQAKAEDNVLNCGIKEKLSEFVPAEYLKAYDFYTDNDRIFRYLRDCVLGPEKYNYLMDSLLKKYNYDIKENGKLLWMGKDEIADLDKKGHIIGLHTHTHPTLLEKMSVEEQRWEYSKNQEILQSIVKHPIETVSHPCGSYTEDTLHILNDLGVKIGFCSSMEVKNKSLLEIPREDHANILKKMK